MAKKMESKTIAILGAGKRGLTYAYNLLDTGATITAVCDIKEDRSRSLEGMKGVNAITYTSDETFFKAGKLADALVIATPDRDHYRHAIIALNLGYHILLEKPVSTNLAQCEHVARLAKEKNLIVLVAHTLRYSEFYKGIKSSIDTGEIGKILSVDITDGIGYKEFAHDFVRGNRRKEETSTPLLLTKGSHDVDLISWFIGRECNTVTSSGTLNFFKGENAPAGVADYCLMGCKDEKTCPYHTKTVYIDTYKKGAYPQCELIAGDSEPSKKDLKRELRAGQFGRCIYKCDNNVCDNQIVTMEFDGGAVATLTLSAFTETPNRIVHIFGTEGEIYGNEESGEFTVTSFGMGAQTVKSKKIEGDNMGGDVGIVGTFVDKLLNNPVTEANLSTMEATIKGHSIVFAAEISRKTNKKVMIK